MQQERNVGDKERGVLDAKKSPQCELEIASCTLVSWYTD